MKEAGSGHFRSTLAMTNVHGQWTLDRVTYGKRSSRDGHCPKSGGDKFQEFDKFSGLWLYTEVRALHVSAIHVSTARNIKLLNEMPQT